MNGKLRQDLYRIHLPNFRKTMVIGTDVVNTGGRTIFGLCASYSPYITQYYTKIATHDLPRKKQEGKIVPKDEQETEIATKRAKILSEFADEALKNYHHENKGALPD
jgi:hypothetical protein